MRLSPATAQEPSASLTRFLPVPSIIDNGLNLPG